MLVTWHPIRTGPTHSSPTLLQTDCRGMRRNLIRADLKRAVSTFEPTSAACGEAIPSRSRGRANRRRRRPNVLHIPVVRDQAREPRLAVTGRRAGALAEKIDERLLDVGRHARGLAAHKYRRLFLQKLPHCVAIRCNRLLH